MRFIPSAAWLTGPFLFCHHLIFGFRMEGASFFGHLQERSICRAGGHWNFVSTGGWPPATGTQPITSLAALLTAEKCCIGRCWVGCLWAIAPGRRALFAPRGGHDLHLGEGDASLVNDLRREILDNNDLRREILDSSHSSFRGSDGPEHKARLAIALIFRYGQAV